MSNDKDGPTTRGWVSDWTSSDPDEMPTELIDAATMVSLLGESDSIDMLDEPTIEPVIDEEIDDPSSVEIVRALRQPIRDARAARVRAESMATPGRQLPSLLELALGAVSIAAVALTAVRFLL